MKYNWPGNGITEKHNILYITVVNLVKAFNSVQRRSLCKFMESYGILHKKNKMIKILKEDNECAVNNEIKTRRWKRIGHEKDKLVKTVAQERQELGWKTFTETKHVDQD